MRRNIVQYNEYYPFGLQTANSWSREEVMPNAFLYNGGSELNSVTNNYEMFFREYDPTLGRMNAVDPMASKYASLSPYNYAFNDPVTLNDPSGADPAYQRSDDTWWAGPRSGWGKWSYGGPGAFANEQRLNAMSMRDLAMYSVGFSARDSNLDGIFMGRGHQADAQFGVQNGMFGFWVQENTWDYSTEENIGVEGEDATLATLTARLTFKTIDQDQQTQGSGSSLDYMDYLGYTGSGVDLLVSGAQFTVGVLKNSSQHKLAYETSKILKNNFNLKIRPSDLRKGTKKLLKNASRKIAVFGGVLAVTDVLVDGNLRASHLLNMGMVVVTAIPVVGWIAGGVYLAGDLATLAITGKNIGDHLDSAVGGHLVNDVYDWD